MPQQQANLNDVTSQKVCGTDKFTLSTGNPLSCSNLRNCSLGSTEIVSARGSEDTGSACSSCFGIVNVPNGVRRARGDLRGVPPALLDPRP